MSEIKPYKIRDLTVELPDKLKYRHDQRLYRFDNRRGASVVIGDYTYGGKDGLHELMEIKWEKSGLDFNLVGDPTGHLTEEEVQVMLREIKGRKR